MAQVKLAKILKNIFKKSNISESKNRNLSAAQAINLQSAYVSEGCNTDRQQNFPYQEIIKQLYSPKDEVFAAAAYYLEKIGTAKQQNQNEIIECLQQYVSDSKNAAKRKQRINQIIDNIGSIS